MTKVNSGFLESVVHMTANGQLTIEQSAKRLMKKVLSVLKEMSTDEDISLRKYPRITQLHGVAFQRLRGAGFYLHSTLHRISALALCRTSRLISLDPDNLLNDLSDVVLLRPIRGRR